jgi:hypothetical protein
MAESAKLLVADVLQGYPVRQWVLSLPIPLRLLLARYPKALSKVMQIIHRAIATDIIHRARYLKKQANTGAVTYIQRFGSALNLNIHFHMLFLEGVIKKERGQTKFKRVKAPSHSDMEGLVNTISPNTWISFQPAAPLSTADIVRKIISVSSYVLLISLRVSSIVSIWSKKVMAHPQ